MEKKRAEKGEKYWYIDYHFDVCCGYENGSMFDFLLFEANNYFIIEEEAEAMANKLRAVLKGADVIEIPPKCEIVKIADEWEISTTYINADSDSFFEGVEWLKTKIVK